MTIARALSELETIDAEVSDTVEQAYRELR
jgi:hypothetical protein